MNSPDALRGQKRDNIMKIILHYQEQEMEESPYEKTSKGQSSQQTNLERLQKK